MNSLTHAFTSFVQACVLRLRGVLCRFMHATVGESLVETLAAILVCTFALLMLYTAVATASRMNAHADEAAAQLRESAIAAHAQTPGEERDYREVVIEGFDTTYLVEYFKGSIDTDADGELDTEGAYTSYRLVK